MQTAYVYGKNVVQTLLEQHPERVQGVFVSWGAEKELRPLAERAHVRIEPLAEHDFSNILAGAVHQGVVAKVAMDGFLVEYEDFFRGRDVTPRTSLVLLNEITDPHNVGAIIRSAAAFGVSGVLLPAHNQAPITGVVAKASAGAVFSIPIIAINNENQTIADLKRRGFWVYGLSGEGDHDVAREAFDAPACFVIGSEGAGLRAKTREHCDIMLTIPIHPRVESLNASVAAGIVCASWARQHREALQ